MGAPLATWLANETSSGTGPTTIHDTSAGPVCDATITYGASAVWTASNGNGLNLAKTGHSESASLSGTKVQTALAGSLTISWEGVLDVTNSMAGTSYDTYFSLYDSISSYEILDITFNGAHGGLVVTWQDGGGTVKYDAPNIPNGRFHLRVDIDNGQSTGTDRCKLWVNGVAALTSDMTWLATPTINTAIDAGGMNWANSKVAIGGFFGGGFPDGIFYFGALYATSPGDHSASLLANNDADPNAVATPVGTSPSLAPFQRYLPLFGPLWPQFDITGPGDTSVAATSSPIVGGTTMELDPAGTLTGAGALAGSTLATLTPAATGVGAGALAGSTAIGRSSRATGASGTRCWRSTLPARWRCPASPSPICLPVAAGPWFTWRASPACGPPTERWTPIKSPRQG